MKSQIKKTTKNFHWKLTKSIYNKLKLLSHTFISPTHWKPSNQHTRIKRKKLITQAIYTPRKVLHPTRDSLMKNLWFLKQRENGMEIELKISAQKLWKLPEILCLSSDCFCEEEQKLRKTKARQNFIKAKKICENKSKNLNFPSFFPFFADNQSFNLAAKPPKLWRST